MNPALFLNKQLSYFAGTADESPIHLFRAPASPLFGHERARIVLRRMEVLSWVFMILVPMWILADMLIFPPEVVGPLVFGRLMATLFLGLLLVFSLVVMERASWLVSYLSVLFLMAIPALFELYAQPVFTAWQLTQPHISQTQDAAIFLYRQLPIIYISGLALFPMTLGESLPIALAITAIDAVVDMDGLNLNALHAAHWAGLWVVLVTGGTAVLAGVLQFNLLWQNHRLADFDAETGLMKRAAAMDLLGWLWRDKSAVARHISVGIMALPAAPAGAGDEPAQAKWLADEAECLRQQLLPDMYGVRWSSRWFGVVSLGHTPRELDDLMNTMRGYAFAPVGTHGHRPVVVAERLADQCVGPNNLLSTAERKLRQALASA
ncbi:MAG: hypothetical protein KGM46_08320 [Pseudomonadota bacterium]|nr:hypothetical protein [Xanthomonadaceae bacterium]MDE3210730.1 hypothetical protein [Pseudomonadota bacterium]